MNRKHLKRKSAESFRRHRFAAVIDLAVYAISYTSIFIAGFGFYIMTERVVEGTVSPEICCVIGAVFYPRFCRKRLGLIGYSFKKMYPL